MEEHIKITWEGQVGEVVVKEITWGEKTDAIKKSIKEVQKGRTMKKEVDSILQKELMMIAAIKSSPFAPTIENLKKLNSKDGERIYNAYAKLNDLEEDDEEGEKLSESGSGTANSLI